MLPRPNHTCTLTYQGNHKSAPTDAKRLKCPVTITGNWWTSMPCNDTHLTGFGGHTIVVGQAVGRLRGVEFTRMGMTNVVGRYPVHFHHSTAGKQVRAKAGQNGQ